MEEMAKEKRMFNTAILKHDEFLDLSNGAKVLYIYLNMEADDEGFVGNPKSIMRLTGTREKDLKDLLQKRYILMFESGVVAIKHWWIHNTIRQDRIVSTTFLKEKSLLTLNEYGAYTEINKLNEGIFALDENGIISPSMVKEITPEMVDDPEYRKKLAIKHIIDYLNKKANKRFTYRNNVYNRCITGRLNDGYKLEDFEYVIDLKCAEWKGKKSKEGVPMENYLNPETLFRPSNFEKYLNQRKTANKDIIWEKIGEL